MSPNRPLRSHLTLEGTPFSSPEFSRLWLLASSTYGVGDIVTTLALIRFSPHVREANPLVRLAFETLGEFGLVGVKLAAFGLCLAVSIYAARDGDRLLYYGPPVGLTLVGGFVTVLNVRLMLG